MVIIATEMVPRHSREQYLLQVEAYLAKTLPQLANRTHQPCSIPSLEFTPASNQQINMDADMERRQGHTHVIPSWDLTPASNQQHEQCGRWHGTMTGQTPLIPSSDVIPASNQHSEQHEW